MKIKTLMILGFSTILTACNTPYHKFKPVVEIAPVSPPSPVSNSIEVIEIEEKSINKSSVHDKFHRALVLSGFFFLKIASTFLNSSFFPKPIKRRIAI